MTIKSTALGVQFSTATNVRCSDVRPALTPNPSPKVCSYAKGLNPPKSNWARALDKPPFEAYPVISSNVFTFDGFKFNTRAQVLNQDGVPMRGLYAAGEAVGMYNKTYTGASSVLKGAVFGRLAGMDAAKAAQGD